MTSPTRKKKLVDEKAVDAMINKGSSKKPVAPPAEPLEPVKFRQLNIRYTEDEGKGIDALRALRPKARGSKKEYGISIQDWIIEALQEKLSRDNEAAGLL